MVRETTGLVLRKLRGLSEQGLVTTDRTGVRSGQGLERTERTVYKKDRPLVWTEACEIRDVPWMTLV